MNKQGVYRIRNLVNGKVYIGSSIHVMKRFAEHRNMLRRNDHHNIHLQRAWDKHGEEAFAFEVLEYVHDGRDVYDAEQYYIDTLLPEYNIARNVKKPMKGRTLSKEARRKISESRKGHVNWDSIEKAAIANRGRKRSKETKDKMKAWWTPERRKAVSKRNSERVYTDEIRANMSKAQKGHKGFSPTAETRAKVSAIMKGRKFSEEHKRKLSEAQAGEKSGSATLTWKKVREIRYLYRVEGGWTHEAIAIRYNVGRRTVSHVLHDDTWTE